MFSRMFVRSAPAAIAVCWALLQPCSNPPAPLGNVKDPSDPAVHVPRSSYTGVTGGYVAGRPVEPRPWREQNERVTPAPKP